MSRTRANKTLSWRDANALLRDRGVTLISAGPDDVPFAYNVPPRRLINSRSKSFRAAGGNDKLQKSIQRGWKKQMPTKTKVCE
jgi:hypothetical protein